MIDCVLFNWYLQSIDKIEEKLSKLKISISSDFHEHVC